MLHEITLFDVPIYGISENKYITEFDKKYEQCLTDFSHGKEPDDHAKECAILALPEYGWKYNQIVGFINVSATSQDIFFNIYLAEYKKYMFLSKKKRWIKPYQQLGMHFRYIGKTEEHIKAQIIQYIKDIEANELKGKYLDKSNLEALLPSISLYTFLDSIEKED